MDKEFYDKIREMVEKKIKELAVYDKQQEEKNVEALEQRERR